MKKSTFFFILISFSLLSTAQLRTTVSAADKATIIQIFQNSDSKNYRLQFNRGREVYGGKTISKVDLDYFKKQRIPAGEGAIIINFKGRMAIYFRDETLIYVTITPGGVSTNEILKLLGSENISKLTAVMIRYVGNPDILDNPNFIDNAEI